VKTRVWPLIVSLLWIAGCVSVRPGNDQYTPDPDRPTPNIAATVSAGFGVTAPFKSFESAEQALGWRVMRPSDPRFHLVQQGGLLRTDARIGLARTEQAYALEGRKGLIEIFQEPEAYPKNLPPTTPGTIGSFSGEQAGQLPHAAFLFFSGEEVAGQRIRVYIYTNQSSDLSEQDFIDFVSSLTFGE
jgi:hypothetical protein